jgi:nucleotide-binding universal stress UspA family protein
MPDDSALDAPSTYTVVAGAHEGVLGERVVLAAAESLANRDGGILHIVHTSTLFDPEDTLALLEFGRSALDRVARRRSEPTRPRVFVHVCRGTPWKEIVRHARVTEANLIVVGTHGRTGAARRLFGSQGDEVIRHASCPVLVVRDPEPESETQPGGDCLDCARASERSGGRTELCETHRPSHAYSDRPGRASWIIRD